MLKQIAAVVIILFLATAYAHEELQTPEYVMNLMMLRQGAAGVSHLDCSRISAEDFEMLGDAVMERMAGSHELHEQMDAMMGGEGSASLRSMHSAMGQNWLGCGHTTDHMMGASMMPMMMRMMGSYYPAYYSGYDLVLLLAFIGWVLFFASIVYFTRKAHKRPLRRR